MSNTARRCVNVRLHAARQARAGPAGLVLALALLAMSGAAASPLSRRPPNLLPIDALHRRLPARPAPDLRLLGFYRALAAVESGVRRDPVVVLQIGDSHTANDAFSGRLRELFQQRFGAAGRGVLPAGIPYPHFRPAGVQVTATGWDRVGGKPVPPAGAAPPPAMIGIAATRMHSAGVAEMTYRVEQPADLARVAIELLRQPGGGTLQVAYDGRPTWRLSTATGSVAPGRPAAGRDRRGAGSAAWLGLGGGVTVAPAGPATGSRDPPGSAAVWVVLAPGAGASTLTLRAGGDGPVDLLAVELRRAPPAPLLPDRRAGAKAGVIWANLGTIGAQVTQVASWDAEVLATDLRYLRPDLIVLAFGTNEGFAASLDAVAYRTAFDQAARRLSAAGATLAVLEPPDGNRRVGFAPLGPPALPTSSDQPVAPVPPMASGPPMAAGVPMAASAPFASGRFVAPALPTPIGQPAALAAGAGGGPAGPPPVQCAPAIDETGKPAGAWIEPPALAVVRSAQEAAARRAGWFAWDWQAAMGGVCSMARWVTASPPLAYADHVHLREAGARQTAEALFSALMAGYARSRPAADGP